MSVSAVSSTPRSQLNALVDSCARWVTWKRARTYSIALCVVYLAIWGTGVVSGQSPLTSSNEPIGGDYIAFYAAGRLIAQGHSELMYDRAAIEAVQAAALNGRIADFYDAYRNPPFFALVFAPIGLLDLVPSFVVWTVISVAILAAALWQAGSASLSSIGRLSLLVVGLGFPAVYFCLIDGQNSTLSFLLYVLIYQALRQGYDRRAGTFAALGLFKPQLFFLFPLLLLVARRWNALAAYVVTALGITLVSVWLVGLDGMLAWVHTLLDYESGNAGRNGWRMSSISAFVGQLVAGQQTVSLLVTLALSLLLIAALVTVWRRPAAIYLSAFGWSLTVLAATLVDPHLVDYDLTVLAAAGVLILSPITTLRLFAVLLYAAMLTRLQIPLVTGAVQPVTLVLLAAAFVLYRSCVQTSTSVSVQPA
jgi:hypothetical protein